MYSGSSIDVFCMFNRDFDLNFEYVLHSGLREKKLRKYSLYGLTTGFRHCRKQITSFLIYIYLCYWML